MNKSQGGGAVPGRGRPSAPWRHCVRMARLAAWTAGLAVFSHQATAAAGDPVPIHALVYVEEGAGPTHAYYLNGLPDNFDKKTGKLIPRYLPYKRVDGVPTVMPVPSSVAYDIKLGDIVLRENPGDDASFSDLIRFTTPRTKDPNKNVRPFVVEFYSDVETLSLPNFAAGARFVDEQDLSDATKFWRVGQHDVDPNNVLNMKGKVGYAFVAQGALAPGGGDFTPDSAIGSILPVGEGPIGYVFVSDGEGGPDPIPEPQMWLLMLAGLAMLLGRSIEGRTSVSRRSVQEEPPFSGCGTAVYQAA